MNPKEGDTMNDLTSLSATKLLGTLKNKQMGSLELLEFYIERYERLNPRVNAIVACGPGSLLGHDQRWSFI
jgi:Asp-tRNA(Asn)/Glu-tRNA(Gln) amidotransferase A subunit family amidase